MSSSWTEDDPDVLGTTIKTPPSLTTNYRTSSQFGLKSSSNQPFAPGNSIRDFRAPALGPTILDPPIKKNRIIAGCSFILAANSATALLSKSLRENHTNDLEALQHKTVSTTTIKKKQRSNSDDENPTFVSPQSQQQSFSESQLSNVLKEQAQRRAHSLVPPRSQMQQKDSLVNLPSSSFPRGNLSRGNYKYHDDAPSLIDDESLINNRAIRAEISHVSRPITTSTANRQILQNSNPHNTQRITYAESSAFSRLTRSQAPRLPPMRKQPETVDLLSDNEDGDHQHGQTSNNTGDNSFACLSSSSSRKTILPERFPLLAIHFGLLEVVASTQSLCTLSLMGSSHNMAWRFNWYVQDQIMITDLEKDDLTGFREYVDGDIVYVALEIRASTRFNNIPVGRNYIIFPDATVNEVEKYIILTMTTETHLKWRNELAEHYPFVLNGEKFDRHGRIKLWENHKQRESMPYNVCRERIEKELGEIKFKQERADRRRAAAFSSYSEDPNDSITFVVYPIEPEVPDAVTISRGDMKRLEPGVYFNDNLIDLKIKHLLAQLNEHEPEKRKRIHAFSCLFYAKLTEVSKPEEAHTLVAKWTKNVDLFAMDYILFPINSANHWSLMVLARPDLLVNWEDDFEKIKAYEDKNYSEREIPVSTDEVNEDLNGKTEINQEGEQNQWTPPLNRPAFLHLDSLNMHPTAKIQQVLARYMFFEREKRYRPAQLLRQQENMKTDEKREKSSDGNSTESNENVKSNLPTSKEDNDENVSGPKKASEPRETLDKSETVENAALQNNESNETSDGLKDTPDEAESTPSVACENGDSTKISLIRSAKKSRKSLSAEETAAQEAALAVKAAMEKFVKSIVWVKCVVPKQQNGYDCGVFVIRFAEMIIQKRPQTTPHDIRDRMRQQFAAEFTQDDIVVERMKLKSFLEGIAPAWKELRDAWIIKMKEEGKEVTDTPVAPVAPSLIESKEEDGEENVEHEVQQENATDDTQENHGQTKDADREIHEDTENEDNGELNIPSSRNRYKLSQDPGKPALPSLYSHMIASHSPLSEVDKPSEEDFQEPDYEQQNKIAVDNGGDHKKTQKVQVKNEQQQLRPRRTSVADAMKQDYRDHSDNADNVNFCSNKRKSFQITASFESAAYSLLRHNHDDSTSQTAESLFDNLVAPLKSELSPDEVGSISPKRAKHYSPQEEAHPGAAQLDSSPSKSSSSSSFINTMTTGFRSFMQSFSGTPSMPSHTKRKRSEYEGNTDDLDTSLKVTVLPSENDDGDVPEDKSKSKRSKKKHQHRHKHNHQDDENKEPTEVTIITSLKHLDDVPNEESEEHVLDLFEDEGR